MKRHFLPNETVFSLGQNYTFYRTKLKNLPDELFLLEGFSLFLFIRNYIRREYLR